MVWAPKVPPGPHPLVDMDSNLTFASPVITRYPLMLQLEQCELSFLLKETPTIPEWPQPGIEPITYGLEGRFPNHLAMLAHTHTYKRINVHTYIYTSLHTQCWIILKPAIYSYKLHGLQIKVPSPLLLPAWYIANNPTACVILISIELAIIVIHSYSLLFEHTYICDQYN